MVQYCLEIIIHILIFYSLDYCNYLLYRFRKCLLKKLQHVENVHCLLTRINQEISSHFYCSHRLKFFQHRIQCQLIRRKCLISVFRTSCSKKLCRHISVWCNNNSNHRGRRNIPQKLYILLCNKMPPLLGNKHFDKLTQMHKLSFARSLKFTTCMQHVFRIKWYYSSCFSLAHIIVQP